MLAAAVPSGSPQQHPPVTLMFVTLPPHYTLVLPVAAGGYGLVQAGPALYWL